MSESFEIDNKKFNRVFYVVLTIVALLFYYSYLANKVIPSGCKSECGEKEYKGHVKKNLFYVECICGAIIDNKEPINERY